MNARMLLPLGLSTLTLVALVTGCGSDSKVVVSPDGSTVSKTADGKTVIETKNDKGETIKMESDVDGKKGTYSDSQGNKIETGVDNADKLGVAIYPGAKADETSPGMSANTAEGIMHMAKYNSSDPIDKVIDFYKKELGAKKPKNSEFKNNEDQFAMFTMEEGKKTTVVTVSKKAKATMTSIEFMVNEKK